MTGSSAELRLANLRAVLTAALVRWPVTKPELARRTGLTQVTVGKVVDQLLALGLLERRGDQVTGGQGRPAMQFCPRQQADLVGVELGVRETRVYRFGLAGEPTPAARVAVPMRSNLAELRDGWQPLRGGPRPLAVVASLPGVLEIDPPAIVYSPNLHWTEGRDLLDVLAADFGAPVLAVQESQALALGHLAGDAASPHFLLVDLDDGIGGTVVAGGRLLGGTAPVRGEIGHTAVAGNPRRCGCGAVGCIETLAGRAGLLQSFRVDTGNPVAGWEELVATVGSAPLPEWLAETVDALALVLAGALNLLGYTEVVCFGELTELHPDVMPRLGEQLAQHTLQGRFGRIVCRAAPRRRQLGLLVAAIERCLLPAPEVLVPGRVAGVRRRRSRG